MTLLVDTSGNYKETINPYLQDLQDLQALTSYKQNILTLKSCWTLHVQKILQDPVFKTMINTRLNIVPSESYEDELIFDVLIEYMDVSRRHKNIVLELKDRLEDIDTELYGAKDSDMLVIGSNTTNNTNHINYNIKGIVVFYT
tara:strand:- start:436 stop:864 length:429 start_codon:yes stop_codon:yes gene_type:complete